MAAIGFVLMVFGCLLILQPRFRYELYADPNDGYRIKTRGIGWTGFASNKIKRYQTEGEPVPPFFFWGD